MNYDSILTYVSVTYLKTEDVQMDWVEKIRAWVDQIPFLKSIHFNFVSKVSTKTLNKVTCISWRPLKSQCNYVDIFNVMKQKEVFHLFAV